MKRFLPITLALSLSFALAACGGQPRPAGPPLRPVANPGAVVAAEIAFNQLAQDKGQWTAFRATAAPEAEMFVPQRVKALDFLKGKPDPQHAVKWQPHLVWSSCDGSIAVTHGAWQRQDSTGYFTTVWARGMDGGYRWILDHGDRLPVPLFAPDMIKSKVAECGGKPGVPITAPAEGVDFKQGVSRDQTLIVSSAVAPDGGRTVTVRLWNGSTHETVLQEQVAAGS